jgi:hypothetical protein
MSNLSLFRNLIYSPDFDISFKSVGILAKLLNDVEKVWSIREIDFKIISDEIVSIFNLKIGPTTNTITNFFSYQVECNREVENSWN